MAKRSREASFSPSLETPSLVGYASDASDSDGGRSNKYTVVDNPTAAPRSIVMQCSLPPHRGAVEFASQADWETHYLKDHTNRCSSCGNNFPTAHFLSLHIEEKHNPLRQTLAAKGEKTYACFVEDCDRKCSTPQKRRSHLIDKHGFPKHYNFRVVETGIDNTTSMLKEGQRRRLSLSKDTSQLMGRGRRESNPPPQTPDPTVIADFPDGVSTLRTKAAAVDVGNPFPGKQQPVGPQANMLSSPATKNPAQEAKAAADADEVGDLARSMSALQFVPTSVLRRQSKKPQ